MQVCLRESVQIPICHGGHLPSGNRRGRRGSGENILLFSLQNGEKEKYMTEVICFVTVVILQAGVCSSSRTLGSWNCWGGSHSFLCPWDFNFLSVLCHYAAGLTAIPDPLQGAQLGVDWEGGLHSKASPSKAVGEGGLLSAAGRSGQKHPRWPSRNPLCLPSVCARSLAWAPACEIQCSITKRLASSFIRRPAIQ